ncbi:MAG: phosphopantothenate/pantothenate synthetase [Methanobrevibacter sp.]|jgi:4-phosphopantoate--beta-alanine ligase|nr:phosphopantothenate/pantothenate synthetase [Candidatus Methanoflexus mossambicus]
MVSKNHPRYNSLIEREKIKNAYKEGFLAETGMIAHGRGETFDYLIGEKTIETSKEAIYASVAKLLTSQNPVISINGNSTALAIDEIIKLSKIINGKIELNLFYRTPERVEKIEKILKNKGYMDLLGTDNDNLKYIEEIESPRATASKNGIYSADTVLVALEDGDRAEILKKSGKFIIAIDLNPLSRTAQMSDITIVDNITRAIPLMIKIAIKFKNKSIEELNDIASNFSNDNNLKNALNHIKNNYNK